MKITVNGISFQQEDLEKVELINIKTQTISRAHLFHLLPGNKYMPLLRAGDFVEPSFISHYLEKGMLSLHQLDLINSEDLTQYKEAWKHLSSAKTEEEKLVQRDIILQKIAKDFWMNSDKSILSFALATFEEFYFFPPNILDHLQAESSILYTRALLMSAISSITALINGYVDYCFVKDLYNTAFIMDFGLVDFGNFNFVMSLACEAERKDPGTGIAVLKKYKRPDGEISVFLKHPHISYQRAMEHEAYFTYPEIARFIKYHHEKTDGSGFPDKLSYSALSDAETLLIFCDYLIPFDEHIFKKGDGRLIIKDYFENLKNINNGYLLPVLKLIKNWELSMEWALKSEEAS